jgi:DNA replication protein
MQRFSGFPEGKIHLTPIPAPFFSQVLPEIDDLHTLKLILYVFWRLDKMEGAFRYLTQEDFSSDEIFLKGIGCERGECQANLEAALQNALEGGLLLEAEVDGTRQRMRYYFLNSPKGRAAVEAIRSGRWRPSPEAPMPATLDMERPNIFRLYEENIGPLTPLIAEALGEAEDTYPALWIEEALRIAVENNKRSWRYVQAILDRWHTEGREERDDRKDSRDSEEARRRYLKWLDPEA